MLLVECLGMKIVSYLVSKMMLVSCVFVVAIMVSCD